MRPASATILHLCSPAFFRNTLPGIIPYQLLLLDSVARALLVSDRHRQTLRPQNSQLFKICWSTMLFMFSCCCTRYSCAVALNSFGVILLTFRCVFSSRVDPSEHIESVGCNELRRHCISPMCQISMHRYLEFCMILIGNFYNVLIDLLLFILKRGCFSDMC